MFSGTLLALSLMFPQVGQIERQNPVISISQLTERINHVRQLHGLKPVKLEPRLSKAANWMAKDCAQFGEIRHKDSRGFDAGRRAKEFGYRRFWAVHENLAGGLKDPEKVVAAWLKSKSHRATLLKADARDLGVGFIESKESRYRYYWAISLAEPL